MWSHSGNAGNHGGNAKNRGGSAGNKGGDVGNQGNSLGEASYLLLWLKSRRAMGALYHLIFTGSCPTISHTFFVLSINLMGFPSRKRRCVVSPRFHLLIFVFGVIYEN